MRSEETQKSGPVMVNERESRWYTVNTQTLPAKFCYIFSQAKDGLFKPYVVLFLEQIGLRCSQAGLITGVSQLGFMVGSPLWGYLADRYQIHRKLAAALCLLSIFAICSQPYIVIPFSDPMNNRCPAPANMTFGKMEKLKFQKTSESVRLFWIMMAFTTAGAFFDGSITAFIDAGTMQRLHENNAKKDFPRQRMFGTVGYASGALLASALIKYFPFTMVTCYTGVYFGYFLLMIAVLFSVTWLLKGLNFKTNEPQDFESSVNYKKILAATFKQGHVIFFFLTVFVYGTTDGFFVFYTFVFLKDLKATTILNGLSLVVPNVFGLLLIMFSKKIRKWLGGNWGAMLVCFISVIMRALSISYLTNPWLILPIQVLGSFWSLFAAVIVEHTRDISPEPIATTMFGILNACFYAISLAVASILGGYIFEMFGGRVLFFSSAVIVSIWTVLIGIFLGIRHGLNRKKVTLPIIP